MGQVKDRIPWWVLMIGYWSVLIVACLALALGWVWLIAWVFEAW